MEYQDTWTKQFESEADNLRVVFDQEVVAIHHIGSTSVPGLRAKPIIDILLVVRDLTKVDRYNESMVALGYTPRGENGIPGRRYFCKGAMHRTHHVHTFGQGSQLDIERNLAFRDYLRSHPEALRQYADLKARLASQFPHDTHAYQDGKAAFCAELERVALLWYRNRIQGNRGSCEEST